ncbi:hypothetical protein AVEN_25965-1 [Araneus ventricosus]|uniref:Uncharacterized protein n=1 Tax=Araneus ventricosus TaxID=182803 RepID=A0A4Y2X6Z1_ARAVE|nr:hypothetical protein AVEN_25965-1 [Araneus ventricosus]
MNLHQPNAGFDFSAHTTPRRIINIPRVINLVEGGRSSGRLWEFPSRFKRESSYSGSVIGRSNLQLVFFNRIQSIVLILSRYLNTFVWRGEKCWCIVLLNVRFVDFE